MYFIKPIFADAHVPGFFCRVWTKPEQGTRVSRRNAWSVARRELFLKNFEKGLERIDYALLGDVGRRALSPVVHIDLVMPALIGLSYPWELTTLVPGNDFAIDPVRHSQKSVAEFCREVEQSPVFRRFAATIAKKCRAHVHVMPVRRSRVLFFEGLVSGRKAKDCNRSSMHLVLSVTRFADAKPNDRALRFHPFFPNAPTFPDRAERNAVEKRLSDDFGPVTTFRHIARQYELRHATSCVIERDKDGYVVPRYPAVGLSAVISFLRKKLVA